MYSCVLCRMTWFVNAEMPLNLYLINPMNLKKNRKRSWVFQDNVKEPKHFCLVLVKTNQNMKTDLFKFQFRDTGDPGGLLFRWLLHPIISKSFCVHEHPKVRYTNIIFVGRKTVNNSGLFS